ncbi:MAG: pyridoxal 5'-phosphate synthase glutaminase subunit PdxT [Myxococcota bacterium]
MSATCIGVLALQGAFSSHRFHLEFLGVQMLEVRDAETLTHCDALILPGGESSTMLEHIDRARLVEPLATYCARRPVWGICAGAILLARSVRSPPQVSLGVLDIEVERNGYGRQLESFVETIHGFSVSFIRAPRIRRVGQAVQIRHRVAGVPVWVEHGDRMATSFHPELSRDRVSPWHRQLVRRAVARLRPRKAMGDGVGPEARAAWLRRRP